MTVVKLLPVGVYRVVICCSGRQACSSISDADCSCCGHRLQHGVSQLASTGQRMYSVCVSNGKFMQRKGRRTRYFVVGGLHHINITNRAQRRTTSLLQTINALELYPSRQEFTYLSRRKRSSGRLLVVGQDYNSKGRSEVHCWHYNSCSNCCDGRPGLKS